MAKEFSVVFKTIGKKKSSVIPRRVGIWKIKDGIWWVQIEINIKRPEIAYCTGDKEYGFMFSPPDDTKDLGVEVIIKGPEKDMLLVKYQVRYGWEGIMMSQKHLENISPKDTVLIAEAVKEGSSYLAMKVKQ